MSNLAGVVRLLKKEQDRLTTELHRIGGALAAFGNIQTGNRHQKAVQVSSGPDRCCSTSAMGKIQGERGQIRQGGSHPGKADTLGCRAKEDRRYAKSAMGEGEERQKDGLICRFAVSAVKPVPRHISMHSSVTSPAYSLDSHTSAAGRFSTEGKLAVYGRLWKSLLTRPARNRNLSAEGMSVDECSTCESAFLMFNPILRPSLSHLVTIFSCSSHSRTAFIERGNR